MSNMGSNICISVEFPAAREGSILCVSCVERCFVFLNSTSFLILKDNVSVLSIAQTV